MTLCASGVSVYVKPQFYYERISFDPRLFQNLISDSEAHDFAYSPHQRTLALAICALEEPQMQQFTRQAFDSESLILVACASAISMIQRSIEFSVCTIQFLGQHHAKLCGSQHLILHLNRPLLSLLSPGHQKIHYYFLSLYRLAFFICLYQGLLQRIMDRQMLDWERQTRHQLDHEDFVALVCIVRYAKWISSNSSLNQHQAISHQMEIRFWDELVQNLLILGLAFLQTIACQKVESWFELSLVTSQDKLLFALYYLQQIGVQSKEQACALYFRIHEIFYLEIFSLSTASHFAQISCHSEI